MEEKPINQNLIGEVSTSQNEDNSGEMGKVKEGDIKDQTKNPPKKKGKLDFDSMESFLRKTLKSRRMSINPRTLRVLKEKPTIDNDFRLSFLEEAARVDTTLEIARQLMLASLQSFSYSQVMESFMDIARDIIINHPSVKTLSQDELFPSPDKENAPKFYDVCRKIVRLREDVELQIKLFVKEKKRGEASSETSINIKSKDDVKALENALWAAAFWQILHRITSAEDVVSVLSQEIFPCKSEGREKINNLLTFLGTCHDRYGLAALLGWFFERFEQEKARNNYLAAQKTKSETECQTAKDELRLAFEKISNLEVQLNATQTELASEREQRRIDCIHQKDAQEQQRVHTLQVLESDIQLISESLVALTREPPKAKVAQNYMTSVFESLNEEIKYLKER